MSGKLTLIYTAGLHLVWALILSSYPPVRTTALDLMLRIFWNSAPLAGGVLTISVVLAVIGIQSHNRPLLSFILITPQQFIVVISSIGAISAMLSGHFADGIIRPHEFIIADQAPAVLLGIMHAIALFERYAWKQQLAHIPRRHRVENV